MWKLAYTYLLLISLLITIHWTNAVISDSVQTLTASSFRPALNDPENGLWLLQFHAPWCGHCKKMAPMLDTVAPLVKGKMAIGKIDCTKEKDLCNEFNIRGFPTLKYARDGDIHDFPFGRSQQDLLKFANMMNAPAVLSCNSMEDVLQLASSTSDNGIVFGVFHPNVPNESEMENVHARLLSTRLTQVFAQSARMQQAFGTYCLLSPTVDVVTEFGLEDIPAQGFIAKMEAGGVPPKLLFGSPDITTPQVLDFIQETNVPLVATLGPHNFHTISKKGKPLVIGAVDGSSSQQKEEMKQSLLDYCIQGPSQLVDKYYFGWLDGKQWNKFLTQFNITTQDLPQVIVLEVPTKTYWHDASYKTNVGALLQAIDEGTVKKKEAAPAGKGRFSQFLDLYFDYYPWSVAVSVAVLVLLILLVLPAPEELRPPYPRQDDDGDEPPSNAATTTTRTDGVPESTSTNTAQTTTEDDTTETKKEK